MSKNKKATQDWLGDLSIMQQSVILSAIRGPDGIRKYHPCKPIIRWFRRCVLISAFENRSILNPYEIGGGSFTGPSVRLTEVRDDEWEDAIKEPLDEFIISRDELPFHYTIHFMHAIQILGYKHPDKRIAKWWNMVYVRIVNSLHLNVETEEEMDIRLGDIKEEWLSKSDEAGRCST